MRLPLELGAHIKHMGGSSAHLGRRCSLLPEANGTLIDTTTVGKNVIEHFRAPLRVVIVALVGNGELLRVSMIGEATLHRLLGIALTLHVTTAIRLRALVLHDLDISILCLGRLDLGRVELGLDYLCGRGAVFGKLATICPVGVRLYQC